MLMKFVNSITIASLFIAGSLAKCSVEGYECCKGTDVKVEYTDETGEWGIENYDWCFIEPKEPEKPEKPEDKPEKPAGPIEPSAPKTDVIMGDTFDSMFIGAWVGGPEKLPEYPQPNAKNVATYEALQGRHLDIIHLFVIWQYHDFEWARPYLDVAKENGSITMMTWMPTPNTAQDILDGKADEYINAFAASVKEYGEEIWIRPLHESNGDWYTWGTGKDNVNNAEDKVAAAYRHIVDIYRKNEVKNVKWIWTTNNGSSGEGSTLTGSYPGDDYVDYVSIDGYNWGTAQSWSSWASFEDVFKDAYNALSQYDKPMFLAEFSSSELGGNKAEWISEMFRILPEKFPRIIGLVWFSESKPDNEGDWGLDTSEEAVEAWKKGISAYPPAKRIGGGDKPADKPEDEPAKPKECWAEKYGYKCCSPGNTRVIEVDDSGKWGAENREWCGIVESEEKCWSLDLGYRCCTDCNVITTDESGRWGALDGNWCGIIEENCK